MTLLDFPEEVRCDFLEEVRNPVSRPRRRPKRRYAWEIVVKARERKARATGSSIKENPAAVEAATEQREPGEVGQEDGRIESAKPRRKRPMEITAVAV